MPYKARFKFLDSPAEATAPSFDALKGGFWINERYQFTRNVRDRKWWIPAHKIEYIERIG